MKLFFRSRRCLALTLLTALPAVAGSLSYVSESEKLDAISAKTYGGYARLRAADGSYRPEFYVFGNGGQVGGTTPGMNEASLIPGGTIVGNTVSDPTIDRMNFDSVVGDIQPSLVAQKYLPAKRPEETQLLIMVYWGRSFGGRHVSDGAIRDRIDYRNATLMGFDSDPAIKSLSDPSLAFWGKGMLATLITNTRGRVLSALEADRYYVILRAFDFQYAWKQKKIRLLWETRFSLSERSNAFNEALPGMAQTAARYFGKDTAGLMLDTVPDGQVKIGPLKSLETEGSR
jgi:hypothetical protein